MVRTCCAINCTNRADCTRKKLSFHKFPTDQSRRFKWMRAVRRIDQNSKGDWQPSKHSALCSEHFLPGDFRHDRGYSILKSDAVPRVFNLLQTSTRPAKKVVPRTSSVSTVAMDPFPESLASTTSVKEGHTLQQFASSTANEHSYAVIDSPFTLKRQCVEAHEQLHDAKQVPQNTARRESLLSDLQKEQLVISQLQQMLNRSRSILANQFMEHSNE